MDSNSSNIEKSLKSIKNNIKNILGSTHKKSDQNNLFGCLIEISDLKDDIDSDILVVFFIYIIEKTEIYKIFEWILELDEKFEEIILF